MKNKKVIAISFADARELKNLVRLGSDSVTNVPAGIWKEIAIEVPADLEISSKFDDKIVIFTAKLVFRELCRQHYPQMAAYKVKLADNSELLIGANERPYPVITESQNLSSGNSNSQLRELTVTYSDNKNIPYIRN